MAAGTAGALSGSLSGGGSRNSGRASSLAAAQGLASRIGGRNNMLDTALASIQASQPPVNPGFDRDPNNINASSGGGVQVSQAELNTARSNNDGPGVLTAGMHQMNSSTPIVGGAKQGLEARHDMGYSSNVSPFSPSELETGGAVFGSDMQRQEIMNPKQISNIDQTGMNSLYGGPLNEQIT